MSETPKREQSQKVCEGSLLWEPSEERRSDSNINRYMSWLRDEKNLAFDSYDELWQWSTTAIEAFWKSMWEFFELRSYRSFDDVLDARRMPGAHWFSGAELNFAGSALARCDDRVAVIAGAEDTSFNTLSYAELREQVGSVAASLRNLGVHKGDRVAAYLPNIAETVIAFLATASVGAIWSLCSPEFGARSVIDRFAQIGPKVLFAVDGYRYGGKEYSLLETVDRIRNALPTLEKIVIVPRLRKGVPNSRLTGVTQWDDLRSQSINVAIDPVSFEYPLWILYSSGTTGVPKPLVHGHGGIILEQLKLHSLHLDLGEEDRFFWFSNTGWVMWNIVVSGLLNGSTIVLYDGSPVYPDLGSLWEFVERTGVTFFGTSAPFIHLCMRAGMRPGESFDLSRLRSVGSTGSPLTPEGFKWVYENVKEDVLLASVSGGTDVCTAFVGSTPILPVRAGEIQCRLLGARVEAFNEAGRSVVGTVGELVVTEPLPSMPLCLWNDETGERYHESYFGAFPGIWKHGDWIRITERGSCVIYGRSDSTLNRAGVRMGTSEFYRVIEDVPAVVDSLVIEAGVPEHGGGLILFVELREGVSLDHELKVLLEDVLRREVSPRHVPDAIYSVPQVPRTLNGKKLEVPIRLILSGTAMDKALSKDAMSNPDSLSFFVNLAEQLNRSRLQRRPEVE